MKFILTVCFLIASSFLLAQQSEFGWLIGTWQEAKYSFEIWKEQDSFLSASAYQIDHQTGSKIINEEIKLIKKENDFYYIPDIAGPQGPVQFKITFFDKNSFVAENFEHDFPKKIVYKRTGELLDATISGGSKSLHFTFKRIK